MGVATQALPPLLVHSKYHYRVPFATNSSNLLRHTPSNSMSQSFHQGIFRFSNGYERSTIASRYRHEQEQQQLQLHIAEQSQRDITRVQGPERPPLPQVGIAEEVSGEHAMYEAGGMLSEMFNFQAGQTAATDILESQIPSNYRWLRQPQSSAASELFGNKLDLVGGPSFLQEEKRGNRYDNQHFSSMNASAVNSMQLSFMNPQTKSSPDPPTASSLLMVLPDQSNSHLQGLHSAAGSTGLGSRMVSPVQFTWVPGSSHGNDHNTSKIGGVVEGQGLSLSLSSSLQHLEGTKVEGLRIGNGGIYLCDQGVLGSSSMTSYGGSKNLGTNQQELHLQGLVDQSRQVYVGLGTTVGMVNVLKNSKYAKAAQELLEEFCSIGRGQFNNQTRGRRKRNPSANADGGNGGGGGGGGPSSVKDLPPLSAAEKVEQQRRKIKLLSMLDEVEGRYNHYCEQMQSVVNSFDAVMGFGAATPYTSLARKAMSRHFRCIKDAVASQLKLTCDLLGEKDVIGSSGLTKGETPRLKTLDQSFRQQRALNQMGMIEPEAWRPQRGLPDRSVNILRAWLFEHFLHPYPSDADKHLLSRQTGLSRNQVSNWFINARVRLWKPMVEEMYQQEAKDEEEAASSSAHEDKELNPQYHHHHQNSTSSSSSISAHTSLPTTTTAPPLGATSCKRSEINAMDSDPSHTTINYGHCFSGTPHILHGTATSSTRYDMSSTNVSQRVMTTHELGVRDRTAGFDDTCSYGRGFRKSGADANMGPTPVRLGTPAGDVSLTLGLQHASNLPEKGRVSVRDFGAC